MYISSYLSEELVFLPTHRIYSPTQTFFPIFHLKKILHYLKNINLLFSSIYPLA